MTARVKNLIGITALISFFAGIIFMNLKVRLHTETAVILSESVKSRFLTAGVPAGELFIYLLLYRGLPLAVLLLAFRSRYAFLVHLFYLVFYLFSYGVCMVICMTSWGVGGALFGIAAALPQALFYFPGMFMMLYLSLKRRQELKRNVLFLIAVILLLWLGGICAENFVAPFVLRKILNFL